MYSQNNFLTCVPSLQRVLLGLGGGTGHSGVVPSQYELKLQSPSPRHIIERLEGIKRQVSAKQHGPCEGLKNKTLLN